MKPINAKPFKHFLLNSVMKIPAKLIGSTPWSKISMNSLSITNTNIPISTTGVVATLTSNLTGTKTYSKVSGSSNVSVNSSTGAVSLTAGLTVGQTNDFVARVTNGTDTIDTAFTFVGVTLLSALTLATSSYLTSAASGTVISAINGVTSGSTLAIVPDDPRFAISGTNLVVGLTPSVAGSISITIVETNGSATNTPRSTTLNLTASDVPAIVYVPDVGTPPQTAVGMARLFADYTGPAARAVRSTDSATLDIATGTDLVDMTAFNAWAAGTTAVDKLYDQAYVKNGGAVNVNDFLQTTAGSRPTIRAANAFAGLQPVTTGIAQNGSLNSTFLNRPALTTARQSVTHFLVVMPGGGLFATASYWALGTSATSTENLNWCYDSSKYNVNGYTAHMYTMDNGFKSGFDNVPTAVPILITVVTSGSSTRYRVNGVLKTTTGAPTAISMTGGYLGKGAFAAGVNGPADVLAELVYPATLSDTDITSVETALLAKFGIQPETKRVTFDGDSITCGYNETGYLQNLPKLWAKASTHARTTNIVNWGQAGITAASVYGRRLLTTIGVTDYSKRVLHNWMGTNDLESGVAAATIWTDRILPYIQYMTDVSRFGSKVIVATTVPRGWTAATTSIASKEAERLALNQLIRDNAATYGYTVADYGGIAALSSGTNGTNPNYPAAAYYGTSTAVHIGPAGYELCRAILQPILDGMLA